jgi:hypothetical protein
MMRFRFSLPSIGLAISVAILLVLICMKAVYDFTLYFGSPVPQSQSASSIAGRSQHNETASTDAQVSEPSKEVPRNASPVSPTRLSQHNEVVDGPVSDFNPKPSASPEGLSPTSGVRQTLQRDVASAAGDAPGASASGSRLDALAAVLTISSVPAGATVLMATKIDGEYLSLKEEDQELVTPIRIERSPNEACWIKVRKDGYKDSEPKLVTFESGSKTFDVSFELVASTD